MSILLDFIFKLICFSDINKYEVTINSSIPALIFKILHTKFILMIDLTFEKEAFEQFFTEVYTKHITEVMKYYPKKRSIIIDFKSLEKFDVDLAKTVVEKPDDMIKAAEQAIESLSIITPSGEIFKPHVRFTNLHEEGLLIEQIGSEFLNKMFSFKGLVTRRGDIMHKAKVLNLKCKACGEEFKIPITRDFFLPTKCPICKKGTLKEVFEESKFVDIQMVEVQDLLERVRAGAPSAKIILILEDDLVNSVVPGDNVEVTAILRININKRKKKNETIFSKYADVVYIKKLKRDFEEVEITKEDEMEILSLAKKPNIEELIVESIAPDIWGYEEIKRAIALQLFGGTKGKKTISGQPIRDDIHILLIGDPGIAKTRFLLHTTMIAPKSIYVGGKTVSGVGLTASAEKDELSGGGWTLKAGALVLASGGVAAIDEFDKINEEDRAALHEVMESGTVSIAKAGIVARFKAKTSIIAAANPKFGRFQQNRNLVEQFNIPPSLFSRFDLIFPIIDVLNLKKDEDLATHILDMHKEAAERIRQGKIEEIDENIIAPELLRKYIAYARKNIYPILSEEAVDSIKDYYINLRKLGESTGVVPITPRYLEGLVRLAEANAKMRLSDVVERRDALVAINLMDYIMKEIMTDQETGKIDVDIITTGKPQSEREKAITVLDIIKDLSKQYDEVEIDAIIQEASSYNIDASRVRRILEELRRSGDIYFPRHGYIKLTSSE